MYHQFMFHTRYKSHQCVPHEGDFIFIVGVGDIFPTPIDMKNHLMLLHFLVLSLVFVHVLDFKLGIVLVAQQVV